jgi:hypothetical protein
MFNLSPFGAIRILFFKSEQYQLIDMPVQVGQSIDKHGHIKAAHVRIQKVRAPQVKPAHQTSLFGDEPEPTRKDKQTARLDAFVRKHGGLSNLAQILGGMTEVQRKKLHEEMAKLGGKKVDEIEAMFAGAKLEKPAQVDMFAQPAPADVKNSLTSAATESVTVSPAHVESPKLYRYALQYRPPGIGAVPNGYVEHTEDQSIPAARHGVIAYDHELTADEVKQYELVPLGADGAELQLPKLPYAVRKKVEEAISTLHAIAEYVQAGEANLADYKDDIDEAKEALHIFATYAGQKGIDKDKVLDELGGVPEFNLVSGFAPDAPSAEKIKSVFSELRNPPKEGDHKTENGVDYVLRDGRWHRATADAIPVKEAAEADVDSLSYAEKIEKNKFEHIASALLNKGRVYLAVPYLSKDMAKHYGAKFDSDKKLWYATSLDTEPTKISLSLTIFVPQPGLSAYSKTDAAVVSLNTTAATGVEHYVERDKEHESEFILTTHEHKADGKTRAAAGGQAGVNGYRYAGGQFLPSTMAEPGIWKIGKKWITSGREIIEPGVFAVQPTPFSRSILASLGSYVELSGKTIRVRDGINFNGEPITRDTMTRLGVNVVKGKEEVSYGALIDAYNGGQRWFDIKPDSATVTTEKQPESASNKTIDATVPEPNISEKTWDRNDAEIDNFRKIAAINKRQNLVVDVEGMASETLRNSGRLGEVFYAPELGTTSAEPFGVSAGITKQARLSLNSKAADIVTRGGPFSDADKAVLRQYSGNGGCGDSHRGCQQQR